MSIFFSGVSLMSFLDSIFSSGTKDELAKTDVYDEKRDSAINKKADKINDNVDTLDRLKNDPRYVKSLSESLKNKKIKSILDKNSILNKLAKLLNGDYSLLAKLLPLELGVLLKLYETKDNRTSYRVNGRSKSYTDEQWDSYVRANSMLDNVAPIPDPVDPDDPIVVPDPTLNTFTDITGQVAIFTQIITAFADLHDSDSIANAISRITDPEVKREVYYAILDTLIRSSDLNNLDAAVTFLGAPAILARAPNIIIDLLGAFTIPEDVFSADFPALQTKLLNLLIKINPYWYQIPRDNTVIRNLKPYILMSDDAKKIITPNSIHTAACMISDSYREVNIVDVARGNFPTAPI
jgi:hypothetical protein